MAVSNGVIVAAAVIVVAAVGGEAYMQAQDVRDLHQALEGISTTLTSTNAAATTASTTAAQAVAKAEQADATATQARATADQAEATATAAKDAADRVAAAAPAAAPAPQTPAPASNVLVGRDLALQICAACHVVAADQGFPPTLRPPAPEFRAIANNAATTETSLHDFMLSPHGKMPNPMLVEYQVTALVDYIMSLRGQH